MPSPTVFEPSDPEVEPGAVLTPPGVMVPINANRSVVRLLVTNHADRPIQVSRPPRDYYNMQIIDIEIYRCI